MDFSSMTLTQIKRQEMDTQVSSDYINIKSSPDVDEVINNDVYSKC